MARASKNGNKPMTARYHQEMIELIRKNANSGEFLNPSEYITYRCRRLLDLMLAGFTVVKEKETAKIGAHLVLALLLQRVNEANDKYKGFHGPKTEISFRIPQTVRRDLLVVGRATHLFFYSRDAVRLAILMELDLLPSDSILTMKEFRKRREDFVNMPVMNMSEKDATMELMRFVARKTGALSQQTNEALALLDEMFKNSR